MGDTVGFFVRGFGFTGRPEGGIDIVVRATDSSHSPITRRLHMSEEELYEMLALLGISADEVPDDLSGLEEIGD
jgi:hypothetical protein